MLAAESFRNVHANIYKHLHCVDQTFAKLTVVSPYIYIYIYIKYYTYVTDFTLCGPCIVIYLHNKDQHDELFFLNLFQ